MIRHLCVLLAFLTLPLALAADSEGNSPPCVPAGSSAELEFERPPLGQDGDPKDAEWTNEGTGNPQGKEEDTFRDDKMGSATAGDPPDKATLAVENKAGKLSGPNGEVQNGAGEGDCIEVYVEWTYRYPATLTRSSSVTVDGVGSGVSIAVVVWKFGKKKSEPKELCPC
jgi:hypothetical protein